MRSMTKNGDGDFCFAQLLVLGFVGFVLFFSLHNLYGIANEGNANLIAKCYDIKSNFSKYEYNQFNDSDRIRAEEMYQIDEYHTDLCLYNPEYYWSNYEHK